MGSFTSLWAGSMNSGQASGTPLSFDSSVTIFSDSLPSATSRGEVFLLTVVGADRITSGGFRFRMDVVSISVPFPLNRTSQLITIFLPIWYHALYAFEFSQ